MGNPTVKPRRLLRLPSGCAEPCETGMGKAIDPKSPKLAWLIEHAGNMYTLFAHDDAMKDGLTPFRRLKGRDWQVSVG